MPQYVNVFKRELPSGTLYINGYDGSTEFAPKGGEVVPGAKPPKSEMPKDLPKDQLDKRDRKGR